MATVYLALGANVGDPAANIRQAVKLLGQRLRELHHAPVYASKPVGVTDQPDFLNTAVSGLTDMLPLEIFRFIKEVERAAGRVERRRWGPREIDIDIIFYDDQVIETAELTVPHPRFRERDFVLRPLNDLNPNFVDPLSGKTVQALLAALPADLNNIIDK